MKEPKTNWTTYYPQELLAQVDKCCLDMAKQGERPMVRSEFIRQAVEAHVAKCIKEQRSSR